MPFADKVKQIEYQKRWNKEYYQANQEKEKGRILKRKREITQWLLNYKSTLSCKVCGEKETACLDFHHTRNKDFSLGQVKSWGWGREKIQKEIEKCIVLCSNCHRKTHAGVVKI